MDTEHDACNCGRAREVADRAQSFVLEYTNLLEAYEEALSRTIEPQPEWTEKCSFWDCVADFISLNYDLDNTDKIQRK